MLNTCVNFVNKSCINKCITNYYIYTGWLINLFILFFVWVKELLINKIIPILSNILSTYKNSFLYLIKISFTYYPQSLLLIQLYKN